MFESNLLVKNGRFFIRSLNHTRRFCQPPLRAKLQEKYYIVEVKNDVTKLKETTDIHVEKSSIKEIPTRVTREHWGRLFDAINEITSIYKNKLWFKMEKVGIDEKFIKSKKQQGEELWKTTTEKTPEKLKELSAAGQEQWVVIKRSEGFSKFKELPSRTVNFTKDAYTKVHRYWIIFDNSPYKTKAMEILNVCITYGKKGSVELCKFYKHVINAPVKKIKH